MILGNVLLFLGLGAGEIFLIMLVALLLFGAKRIPELARGLGRGMREFKDATQNIQREINSSIEDPFKESTPSSTAIKPPSGSLPYVKPAATNTSVAPDGGDGIKPGSGESGEDAGNKPDGNGN